MMSDVVALVDDAAKGNRTVRCTDRAYDELLAESIGSDNAIFEDVVKLMKRYRVNGEDALRLLCGSLNINPDA